MALLRVFAGAELEGRDDGEAAAGAAEGPEEVVVDAFEPGL